MLRNKLAVVAVLAAASIVRAGADVDLRLTDRNDNVVPNGLWSGGEEILVGVWLTSDQTVAIRGMQVDHRASDTALILGTDTNQGGDGIANFWFDYFGSQSELPVALASATVGQYADFSNLLAGPNSEPTAPASVWTTTSTGDQIELAAGIATRIGAMPVKLPTTPGTYTLDLLNAGSTDMNDGLRIDFDFTSPQVWSSINDGNVEIAYGQGSGALAFTVVPEPATLALLGLGGIGLLRRRKA